MFQEVVNRAWVTLGTEDLRNPLLIRFAEEMRAHDLAFPERRARRRRRSSGFLKEFRLSRAIILSTRLRG
jgi:hypothetical protein